MADLTINNVNKFYDKTQVLFDVSLSIHDGEFIVLVGPSGCGKSTLLRMIAGLEDINSGEISLGERVINQLAPRDRDCLLYTSPSPRDQRGSRMPSSA